MQILGPILDVSGKVWTQTCTKYRPGSSDSQVRLFFHTVNSLFMVLPNLAERIFPVFWALMHRFLFVFSSLPFDIGCNFFQSFPFHAVASGAISEGLNALVLSDHAVCLLSSVKLSCSVATPLPGPTLECSGITLPRSCTPDQPSTPTINLINFTWFLVCFCFP